MGDANRLRTPSWTDARLVAGLLMMLVSVVAGAAVVGNADKSVTVWAVRTALPAGTTLTESDLTQRRVRLFGDDRTRYLDARGGDPAGRVLTRALGDGELLPVGALGQPGTQPTRVVGLPLTRAHALGGEVRRGDVVDVLATRKEGGELKTYTAATGVRVVGVDAPSSGFTAGRNDFVVLVEVAPAVALDLAAAIRGAELDLARVQP
ncbi:MAG TPA: SAF domain-containing protein [Frankiaceae bacterium]|nr:SAF domain-containing protein [Frankiaceae bacterium]